MFVSFYFSLRIKSPPSHPSAITKSWECPQALISNYRFRGNFRLPARTEKSYKTSFKWRRETGKKLLSFAYSSWSSSSSLLINCRIVGLGRSVTRYKGASGGGVSLKWRNVKSPSIWGKGSVLRCDASSSHELPPRHGRAHRIGIKSVHT